jgi:hypothetical protein
MPNLYAIPAGPALGPVYVKQDREHYAPELGETCSLTDRVFQDKSSQQKLHFEQHPWQPPNVRLIDYIYPNPLPVQALPDPRIVIREYRKMIKEHVERRILFFFQQMIVCYQTKLHFESVGAQDQGKSADAVDLNVQGHPVKYVVRQAAHSSGNPCLVAYDNNRWQMFQAGMIAKPEGFVFLKDTDYYRTVNATMNMPKWINDADREIDEKTVNSLLRSKGEGIINRDSQGLVTPDQGMIEYIQEALNEVRAARHRLAQAAKDPQVQEVLAYYEKYLLKFQRIIGTDSTFLEKFLNIMQNGTQDERSKRVILQMRYAAIRNCQLNQSVLIQKVETLSQAILAQLKAANRNRKPDNFDGAFRAVVVEHARGDENRQRLEKLLNFSAFNFEAQLQGGARTKYFNTKTSVSAYSAHIDFLVRDILADMRQLRTQEEYQRAQIVKDFRAMKGWQQWRLGQEVRQIYPYAAASQSTISRIENRKKLVTPQIAEEFSRVFNVDSGLFMPHFFYD